MRAILFQERKIQMAFPSKAANTPPSFGLSSRSARIWELQRLRIQSDSAAQSGFSPPLGGFLLSPGGGEREWTCERRALFSSAIKQQQ